MTSVTLRSATATFSIIYVIVTGIALTVQGRAEDIPLVVIVATGLFAAADAMA